MIDFLKEPPGRAHILNDEMLDAKNHLMIVSRKDLVDGSIAKRNRD